MSKDKYDTHIVRSSQGSIEEFFDSLIWKDIKGLREDGITALHVELETETIDHNQSMFIRGKIKCLRDFINLETELLDAKKLQDEVAALEAAEKENENGNRQTQNQD